MVHVERTFPVDRPARQVLEYLADFAHAEAWDPGTESCTRIDDGPVVVGARWRNVSKIAGATTELTYELTEQGPGRIVLVGTNDTATSTDTITAVDTGGGHSEVTYAADIELHGLAKVGSPAMKVVMERLGSKTVDGITTAVAGLSTESAPSKAPAGEPLAGTEPGGVDPAEDTVLEDPGTAGDTPDPDVAGPTAVTPPEAS